MYIVKPPQFEPRTPDRHDYILLGLIKNKLIDIADMDKDTINDVNWALSKLKMPPLPRTKLVATPKREAKNNGGAHYAL